MGKVDRPRSPSRRRFLRRTGWAALGLTVVAGGGFAALRPLVPVLPTFADPAPGDGLAWVQLLPDGRVRFYCPRMEMGQGVTLGLTQIVAEELNLPQDRVESVTPDTSQAAPFRLTVGSEGIFAFSRPVAIGAATLREALRARAAERLGGVPEDREGGFAAGGVQVGYADLAPQEPEAVSADPETRLYSREKGRNHTAIGKDWRHHDLHGIVTGTTRYSRDATLPGMLYGSVLHPPGPGARLVDVDASAARAMPSVRAVVIERRRGFVGVVTESPFALQEAKDAIIAEWDGGAPSQVELDAAFDVEALRAKDDFAHVLADEGTAPDAATRITARYDTPFMAHSPMEPRASVVWVREGRAEVWCGTQDPFFVRGRVAKIAGLEPEQVVVHPHRMGGGFGGRIQCQPSEEAARLSAAIGQPVRVQWSREDEMSQGYFQPAFSHHLELGADGDSKLAGWAHDFVTSPILFGPMPHLLGKSGLVDAVVGTMDDFVVDEGSTRGALVGYATARRRVRFQAVRTAIPTSAWRGLGAGPHAFAIESALDELAYKAGLDPLDLRLKNLPPSASRLAAVLKEAARMAGWGRAMPPGHGLGIACANYKDQTPVAVVAEVRVDEDAGEIRVQHIWCAQDCGLVINPDQVRNLVEGNIVWGCSMALKERITVEDGSIAEQNFHSYEILRHDEAPDIEVSLIAPPDAAPSGVGESALAPVAPAIANAVFAASGHRLRRLPMAFDQLPGRG